MSDSVDDNAVDTKTDWLDSLAGEFREGVAVRDRKYHLQTYKNVFRGKDAVDYLVSSGQAASREDAISLGSTLQKLYLFEHVTRDHNFGDNELFYRFIDNRGSLAKDPATGEPLTWGYFLSHSKCSYLGRNQPLFPQNDLLPDKDKHVASQVWPLDKHNQELLDNVHPPNWQNPSNKDYDIVVIGGGAAGLITAAGSAGVGAKVALIEAAMLGGDCLNVGCVPSKTLIHAATLAHTMRNTTHLATAGINLEGTVTVDFPKVMERVRSVRSNISHHDSAERYSKELGVDIYIGWAQFTGARSIVVQAGQECPSQSLSFKRAAICTGGYPVLVSMTGLAELHTLATMNRGPDSSGDHPPRPQVMTNETFFNLTEAPEKMIVIGAGVIGMELAQSMQRLGVSVTVLGRSGNVLPKENVDMADVVKQQMIADGVEFRLNVKEYRRIELTGKVLANGYPEMKVTLLEKGNLQESVMFCDAVLVAAGRAPNVTGMNLEMAKVEYDKRTGIKVNDYLQTTNKRIYGVGDVCSQYKFTHAADFMARSVIRNALFFGKEKMSNLLIPYATFTQPEIASVGLYESDLEAKGIAYRTFEKHFKDNDRAICDDSTAGFVRFRVDAKTDKILGASIVGENAGNLISEVTLAMQSETGLGSLASVIHPYPTTAEVLRQSGDLFNKTKLTATIKKVLRGVVKLQR